MAQESSGNAQEWTQHEHNRDTFSFWQAIGGLVLYWFYAYELSWGLEPKLEPVFFEIAELHCFDIRSVSCFSSYSVKLLASGFSLRSMRFGHGAKSIHRLFIRDHIILILLIFLSLST